MKKNRNWLSRISAAFVLVVCAVVLALSLTGCLATSGEIDVLQERINGSNAAFEEFRAAVERVDAEAKSATATAESRDQAFYEMSHKLQSLGNELGLTVEQIQAVKDAAREDTKHALVPLLGTLPVEGQLGLGAALSVLLTNFWRDRKRTQRGESTGSTTHPPTA